MGKPLSKDGKPFSHGGTPLNDSTGCGCCGCENCTDGTQDTILGTFTGIVLCTGCIVDQFTGSPTGYIWDSAANLNQTLCFRRAHPTSVYPTNCTWVASFSALATAWDRDFLTGFCVTAVPAMNVSTWYVVLSITPGSVGVNFLGQLPGTTFSDGVPIAGAKDIFDGTLSPVPPCLNPFSVPMTLPAFACGTGGFGGGFPYIDNTSIIAAAFTPGGC